MKSQIWSGLRPSGASTPCLASSELRPCLSAGLWLSRHSGPLTGLSLCVPALPHLSPACSTDHPSTVHLGDLLCTPPGPCPGPGSQHPLHVPSLPRGHCLCLSLLPPQGRAWPRGAECKGFLGGEDDGGPGGAGDRSLGSSRRSGQGPSMGAWVRQLRGAAVPLCVFAHADPQDTLLPLPPRPQRSSSQALFGGG